MSKPYPPRPLPTIRQPTYYPQPRGLLWQMSENGTLPEADRALHDDNKLLPVLDPQACEVCRRITISALTIKTAPYGFKLRLKFEHFEHELKEARSNRTN
jgi:hypothetical protein